jgi:hypothetical protein
MVKHLHFLILDLEDWTDWLALRSWQGIAIIRCVISEKRAISKYNTICKVLQFYNDIFAPKPFFENIYIL